MPASSAFSQAQSNLTLLTSIIGGTCNTNQTADACDATMDWMAQEIQKPTVCGLDLDAGNALAFEALHGFQNYGLMRQAGCLVNQNTNSYCLVDAVASASPADFYYYTLPLGNPVPNNTIPSCSTCTESVLAIYATQATNSTLLISKTYPSAAQLAVDKCGAKYAVEVGAVSGGTALTLASGGRHAWVVALSVLIGVVMASVEM